MKTASLLNICHICQKKTKFLRDLFVIIFRYLLKEVAKTQFAVFFVLMTIFISQKFVRMCLGECF